MADKPIREQSALELLETHAKALEAENERLRAALERYGSHTSACRTLDWSAGGHSWDDACCDCGLRTALKSSASEMAARQEIQGVELKGVLAAVFGIPGDDHNCDAMGCPSVDAHTLWRGVITAAETGHPVVACIYREGCRKHPQCMNEARCCGRDTVETTVCQHEWVEAIAAPGFARCKRCGEKREAYVAGRAEVVATTCKHHNIEVGTSSLRKWCENCGAEVETTPKYGTCAVCGGVGGAHFTYCKDSPLKAAARQRQD